MKRKGLLAREPLEPGIPDSTNSLIEDRCACPQRLQERSLLAHCDLAYAGCFIVELGVLWSHGQDRAIDQLP
jgi:hypothetical protein